MEALDLIEQRLARLENLFAVNETEMPPNEPVIDTLISTGTLLSSAVSARDNISTVCQRSTELDSYMDESFIDKRQLLEMKKSYIDTVAPDIAMNAELLNQLQALAPSLDSVHLRDIPDIKDKLSTLRKHTSEQKQSCGFVEESLYMAIQRYHEIHNSITDALAQMNERLDTIDAKLKPVKKQVS